MAKKCSINFVVNVIGDRPAKLFICGNTPALGDWTPTKAKEMKAAADGSYTLKLSCNEGDIIEFKLLKAKSWESVDKGMFGEEIENHIVIAEANAVKEVTIYNWADTL